MPLPLPGSSWPPPGHDDIHRAIRTWDAWYVGSRDELARVYGGTHGTDLPPGYREFSSQYRGGVVGAVARWFWGSPQTAAQRSPKLHVPAAADIASTSASLLFGEPPTLTVDDPATQARLDELFGEHTWAQLLTAAELQAGLGGVFLRVGWDSIWSEHPLLSVIGPDQAYSVFTWGHLAEVTFCWALTAEHNKVLRHLELHTPGRVEHALYLGDQMSLGMVVPLTEHPATAALVEAVDADGGVDTGLDRLDVVYVPNMPSRLWRTHQVGTNLGQPDIAGVEPLLDALDEAFTSWMRDLRLAKARAVTGQDWLTTHGSGKGASFDLEQELFVGLNLPPVTAGGTPPITLIQPAIRHTEHAATCAALLERVIAGAGYSAQTFGLTGEVAMTATESDARERKTVQTRSAKARRWRLALAELAEVMLMVDAVVYGTPVKPVYPSVEFPPIARDNPEVLARTVQLLLTAEAASTRTRVALVHPDWSEEQVDAEVAAIEAAQPVPPPEPMGLFGG